MSDKLVGGSLSAHQELVEPLTAASNNIDIKTNHNMTTSITKNTNSIEQPWMLGQKMRGLCKVNGVTCEYIFDTGASVTLIDPKNLNRVRGASSVKLETSKVKILSASGEFVSHSKAKMTISIGTFTYTGDILVADKGMQDVILLGRDIIKCPFFQVDVSRIRSTLDQLTTELLYNEYRREINGIDDGLFDNLFVLDNEVRDCIVSDTDPEDEVKRAEVCISAMFEPISATKYSDLTPSSMICHKIELIDPHMRPIRSKIRKVPFAVADTVKAIIQEQCDAGIVRKSNSPWASPIRLVYKENGDIRITVDYTRLNKVTIPDACSCRTSIPSSPN